MHYATMALVELAKCCESNTLVSANEISERHGIPGPFLVQILRTLRDAGWVQSVRGSHGGYRLTARPEKLTLLDVAEVTGQLPTSSGTAAPEKAEHVLEQKLHAVWAAADQASRNVLSEITLEDLVEHCQNSDQAMFYI